VDVERIDDEFEYLPIVQHFFTQEEKRYIRQSKAESRKRFYEIWTRKEAFLKAVGTGITENLGVDVLHEKMKGVAIRENGSTGKNLLLRSMLFEQDFMITLAMCADSGNLHKYIIGFGNNDLSRFGS
jgi:phosphopantetheine--protein transferase-like protein